MDDRNLFGEAPGNHRRFGFSTGSSSSSCALYADGSLLLCKKKTLKEEIESRNVWMKCKSRERGASTGCDRPATPTVNDLCRRWNRTVPHQRRRGG